MLVLSRKVGERILIDERIEIEVIRVSKNKVRLGITAPRDVEVIRSELREIRQTAVPISVAPAPACVTP